MAIAALPTVFKSFTFGGESSADYGVQILGEGVFNSPERVVELVSVPGRNGSIAIDQGYWENIEVTYPAALIARNPEEFATAMANFRNMLCSKRGYCRLSDDYHPDEYRMAMFNNDIEVNEKVLMGGEFDITFNCKPQRWLTSGETAVTLASGDTLTNPTRYESEPLLEVEGNGSISFNGFDIDFAGRTLGRIRIMGTQTGTSSTGTASVNASANAGSFNAGDDGTCGTMQIEITQNLHAINVLEIASQTGDITGATASVSNRVISLSVPSSAFEFPSSGSSTTSGTITLNIKDKNVGTSTLMTATVALSVVVTKVSDEYTITVSVTFTPPSQMTVSQTKLTVNGVVGNSTVSTIDGAVFIDCSIGEAYTYIDGQLTTLNDLIAFGSDLPTLATGDNEIVYDNTITSLKITPRWWRL